MSDVLDYFLNKLCAEKESVRLAALLILGRLLSIDPKYPLDLVSIVESFKRLRVFNVSLMPKHFRRALLVETSANHLVVYINFIFEQFIIQFQDQVRPSCELRERFNEMALDLAEFYFKRAYCLRSSFVPELHVHFAKFALIVLNLNEFTLGCESDVDIESLLRARPRYDRESSLNSFLLIELSFNSIIYIDEKAFNLALFLILTLFLIDQVSDV